MAKLTDKQRKKIIADRANGASMRSLARKYHVSDTTIRRTLNNDPETVKKVAQKKAENTVAVLAHMDKKQSKVCDLIDLYLDALTRAEKLDRASVRDIATALGIVIDKFTSTGLATDKLRAEVAKLQNTQDNDQRELEDVAGIRNEVFGDE